MSANVLCVLAAGFEEIETVVPVDLLRRAGAKVLMATIGEGPAVQGRSGITLMADAPLEVLEAAHFDLLLLPGGPGVKALRADGRAAVLAVDFVSSGRAVAAICAGPLLLSDAGLLQGRRYTAHFSTVEELPEALAGERVVEDGPLITARGAGTALDFGLALVHRLYGEAKAEEIARAIMA